MHECCSTHFPSVILLNNVLSLRQERPHLHHFVTKWNKFSFDKPAGAVAGGWAQPIKSGVWGLCETSLIIVLTPVFRSVLQHPFYILPLPNSFPAENEFPSSRGEQQDYRKLQFPEINYWLRLWNLKGWLSLPLLSLVIFTPIVCDGGLRCSLLEGSEIEVILQHWLMLLGISWPITLLTLHQIVKRSASCFCIFRHFKVLKEGQSKKNAPAPLEYLLITWLDLEYQLIFVF